LLLHPSIAESGFAALGAAVSAPVGGPDLPDPAVVCPDLLQRFAAVSDGRRDQGRVHPVAVVLVLCAAAVVAGMASFTAIAGWATDVPAEMLARLYGRRCDPPSKATIWRVVTGVDADAVDAVIGAWLLAHAAGRDAAGREVAPDEVAGREVAPGEIAPGEVAVREADQAATEPLAIMVDGKAVRGATDAEGNQVHLLAAATHADALVLGQVEVGAKSNEVRHEAPCRIPNSVRRNLEDSSWVRWLTRSRNGQWEPKHAINPRSCPDARSDALGGTRVIWRKLNCLNPNLQRCKSSSTGKGICNRCRALHPVISLPGATSRALGDIQ
jgi:hypothetical protein